MTDSTFWKYDQSPHQRGDWQPHILFKTLDSFALCHVEAQHR